MISHSEKIQSQINQYFLNNQQGYEKLYPENVAKFYNEVALELGWSNPVRIADVLDKEFSSVENKDDIAILDLGCGTGLVGEELAKKGFHNIIGVDACKSMIVHAEEKKIYKEIHQISINNKEDLAPLFENKFDAVVSSGFIGGPNHGLEPTYEAHLVCAKLNGLIVFTSSMYCRKQDFEAERNRLEGTGQWKKVSEELVQIYPGFQNKGYKPGGKFIGKSVNVFSIYRRTK